MCGQTGKSGFGGGLPLMHVCDCCSSGHLWCTLRMLAAVLWGKSSKFLGLWPIYQLQFMIPAGICSTFGAPSAILLLASIPWPALVCSGAFISVVAVCVTSATSDKLHQQLCFGAVARTVLCLGGESSKHHFMCFMLFNPSSSIRVGLCLLGSLSAYGCKIGSSPPLCTV